MKNCMRATVTVRDDLLDEADRTAKRLGMSRSRLFQEALERYLVTLRQRALTEQANANVEHHGQPLDASFERYVARVWAHDMGDDEW